MNNFNSVKTFDDILLVPKLSKVKSRRDNHLNSKISKNVNLNFPIISSNMDTVTEEKMAISIAEMGGIGILHRFCTIEKQIEMINSVKRYRNFVIDEPYNAYMMNTLEEVYNIFCRTGVKMLVVYRLSNNSCKWVGIILLKTILLLKNIKDNESFKTTRLVDIDDSIIKKDKYYIIENDENLSLNDYIKIFEKTGENWIFKLSKNAVHNEDVSLITLRDILNITQKRDALVDNNFQLKVGAAIGVTGDYLERAEKCLKANVDVLVIDIAHGHSLIMENAFNELKKLMENIGIQRDIIAGNVATKAGVKFLAELGVDGIKVGIGNGSICSTRIMTGCGYPQFTAVLECAAEAKKYNVPIISDGGNQGKIGNICKALSVGASCVMLGNFISGTDESPGNIIQRGKEKVKYVRGMAGLTANKSKWEKLGEEDRTENFVPEGVDAFVKYKGKVRPIFEQIKQGIRSCMSYCGSTTICELQENAEWISISESAKIESGIHGVSLM